MNLLFLFVLEVVNVFSGTMYEQTYTAVTLNRPLNVIVFRQLTEIEGYVSWTDFVAYVEEYQALGERYNNENNECILQRAPHLKRYPRISK